jgi:thioredoxin-related protein
MRTLVAGLVLLMVAVMSPAQAEGLWTEDFAAAQKLAEKEGKDLLVDFTGSDWCHWCIKLKEEVFNQQGFKDAAPKNFILVELDYPRAKKQDEKIKQQNEELREKYEIQGYPAVLLMNAKGEVYARTGYQAGGPEKYLTHINGLRDGKKKYDVAMEKAKTATGIDKAKLLDEALTAHDPDLQLPTSDELVKEIMALDKDNAAGLKQKYELNKKFTEAVEGMQNGKFDEAMKTFDEVLAANPPAAKKQQVLFFKSACYFEKKELDMAIKTLEQSLASDPTSAQADRIKQAMEFVKTQKK